MGKDPSAPKTEWKDQVEKDKCMICATEIDASSAINGEILLTMANITLVMKAKIKEEISLTSLADIKIIYFL